MNTTNLIGRLTKDPQMKYTQNGKAVTTFTLAVNRPFKNGNGEYEADFIMIQVWGKTAENAANFLRKGSQAGVVGRIQTRNYDNDQGQKVFVTEVVADHVQFLDPPSKGNNPGQGQGQQGSYQQQPPHQNQGGQGNYQQGGQYQQNQQSYGQPPQGGYQQQGNPNGQNYYVSDDELPF